MHPIRLPKMPDPAVLYAASSIANDPLRKRRLATPVQFALDLHFPTASKRMSAPRTRYLLAQCEGAIKGARSWRSMLNRASVFLQQRASPVLLAALADTFEIEDRAMRERARLLREPYPPEDPIPL